MPLTHSNAHSPQSSPPPHGNPSDRHPGIVNLLTEAEELRTELRDASSRPARLMAGLKQPRRQSRAVQDAVRSLKQFKLDA